MKNKKGFTLIELLAVIAILGVLATISVVAVEGTLKRSKNKATQIQQELFESAAKAYVSDNLDKCEYGCVVSVEDLINEGYIDNKDGLDTSEFFSIDKSGNNYVSKLVDYFNYTGSLQTYTIPETGTYEIEANGAEGTSGNVFSYTGEKTPTGGKGAKIKAEFNLVKGDVLTLVVGGQGSVTQATQKDGTSGAGGGGTFIFKKISSITDDRYQVQNMGTKYETLLVAAGGSGSGDSSYHNSIANGVHGVGASWISPIKFTAYSTQTTDGTSESLDEVLSLSQFRYYDLKGGYFTKNNGVCIGGYGGGGCSDNSRGLGGGWYGSLTITRSFSSGANTSGVTGKQSGHGYATISLK